MKKKKLMLSILLCTSILMSNAIGAFAYETYDDNCLDDGVDNAKYYVSSSASDIEKRIKAAVESWNYSDTDVSITETSKLSSAQIRFYYKDSYFDEDDDNVIARTQFYIKGDGWSVPDYDWTKARIRVHPEVYDSLKSKNGLSRSKNQQGTLAHELGHAMGLAHTRDEETIMCQLGKGRTVYKPQEDDEDGINHLYGHHFKSPRYKALSYVATTDSAVDIDESDFSYIVSEEDCIDSYESIDEITNDADTIIKAEIEDISSCFDIGGIYTDVKIKVLESLEGELKIGDVIEVRLHGGVIEGEDAKEFRTKMLEEDGITCDNVSSERIEEIADGLENFKIGDTTILFLNSDNNKYTVTGSHQGRFKIDNNYIKVNDEFIEKEKEIKINKFAVRNKSMVRDTNTSENVNVDEFIQKIKNSVDKKNEN